MLRIDSGTDHFSIYLDKVLILQHSRRHPLFCVRLHAGPANLKQTGFWPSMRPLSKVLHWQILRSSPENIELQFESLFKLSLLRSENGGLSINFQPGTPAISTLCLRLPVQKNTSFGTFTLTGFEQIRKKRLYAWQEAIEPTGHQPGGLLSDTGILPGSNYRLHEFVYLRKALLSSSQRFVQVNATDAFCRHTKRSLTITCQGLPKEIRMGSGNSRIELLRKHQEQLAGPVASLPDWLHDGLCMDYAGGTDNASRTLHQLLDSGIHLNGIFIRDWAGQRRHGSLIRPAWDIKLDQARYANLQDDIARYKQADIHTLGYITPHLDCESPLFSEARKLRLLLCDDSGEIHIINSRFGRFAYWDLWQDRVRDFLSETVKEHMLALGFDGWFADYGSLILPKNGSINGMSAREARFQYPGLWASFNAGLYAARNQHQPLCIMRAAAEHCGRASMLHCIEPLQSDWSLSGLAAVPRRLLKAGLSGAGLCFSEAGGSLSQGKKHRTPELLMRWLELAAFGNFMFSHNTQKPGSNCQLTHDPELLRHTARFTQLYRDLKPYRKAVLQNYRNEHISPIQYCDSYYAENKSAGLNHNQFMLGPDLLVAPTLQAERYTTAVMLPEDQWVHLWSSREFGGGLINIESPPGYPAAFYRRDSRWSGDFDQLRLRLAES